MRKVFQILLAALLLTSATLAVAMTADFNDEYVEAEGYGPPDQPVEAGNAYAAARRVAIMDAYRYLLEEIGDLNISSATTVKKSCLVDDEIRTKVEAVVHGAKVVSVTGNLQEGFTAKVRLSIYGGRRSLASAVLPENVQVAEFLPPKSINMVSGSYTGVIIDCRGKKLSQAIIPAIKSEDGREIHTYENVGYQATVSKGMIKYATSMDSGVERAGNAPLRITAVRVSGKCDVVVSTEDADKILAANQSTHFLNECAVVFVR